MHRLSYGQAMKRIAFQTIIILALNVIFLSYGNAQKSPHGPLSIACTDCHTTDSWKELARPMKFSHVVTGFALDGQHSNVACIQCHTAKKFSGTPTACFSCHQKDFVRAFTPNHQLGKFSRECLTCHTLNAWKPSIFQHSKTDFQLIGAHQSVDCASCHANNKFTGLSHECFFCHQKDFTNAVAPNHVQGRFTHSCLTCHTMNGWKPATFDHAKTNFPLAGAHRSVDCSGCHAGGKYTVLPSDCYSCHQKDFAKTTAPNHSTGKFSRDCLTCHTINGWKPSTFDHGKTDFALAGAHMATECSSCHSTGQFKGLTKDCFTCHTKDFNDVKQPSHLKAQFDRNCLTCHNLLAWKPSTFDHAKTNYPLLGVHKNTDCASCHSAGIYKGLNTECFTCHQVDYKKTTSPNHQTALISQDCVSCHSMNGWKPSTFDHAKTNFPLIGAHAATNCASCHTSGKFIGLPSDCYSCHQQDFAKTVAPNHAVAQFSRDCLTCHSMNAWKPSTFSHAKTNFQLVGAHVTIACESCHKNGVFKGLPSDCYSCHQNSFITTVNPNHAAAQFSHDCLSCHNTMAWKPSTFNHAATNFPLVGAHGAVICSDCHKNGVYKGLPSDCFSCHMSNFTGTTNPNHVSAQFSHDCLTCHSNIAWKPSTFNHAGTNYPLIGAHVSASCVSCHSSGVYKGLPSDCYSCHMNNFTGTTNPNHVTAQFSHDCLTCHSNIAWKPSTFNHANTSFPLQGSHAAVLCSDCHKNGQYKGTTTVCYTCHLSDFNSAADPNHVTGNFDHNCTSCHSMNGWSPAMFDHNKTIFPLTGSHVSAPCANCHVGGKFAGTPTDCYTCHTQDYNTAVNPNHAAAKYPTDCKSCHTTSLWKPSTFNHTPFFPIDASAKHRPGRWTLCSDCHTNPTNSKVFECINCHEHDKASMDSEHRGRTGYLYSSAACYKCHPTGRTL